MGKKFLFWPCRVACGLLVPQAELGCPLRSKCRAFTTGLPEKPLKIILNNENNNNNQKTQLPGGRLDHNAEETVPGMLAI